MSLRFVVANAEHGIGRALATRISAEGARVVVNDLDAAAAAQDAYDLGGYLADGTTVGRVVQP